MSDLRHDPLTDRQVLVAENRAGRPNDFAKPAVDADADDQAPRADCPFCPGNESQTPEATHQSGAPWRVRVVPNKYPAIDIAAGHGVHEVVIESRDHVQRTGQLDAEQIAELLVIYAHRMEVASQRFPYRLLFKNVGASAGASLGHLHSQLIALPTIPREPGAELRRLAEHRSSTGRCGWCDRVAEERTVGERIVVDHGEWLAFCPNASRQPLETWILPTAHQILFESIIDQRGAVSRLAELLLSMIGAVEAEIGAAGYNLMIRTSPKASLDGGEGHWRIEIVPRVASLAGLELSTGLFVNVLPPERAAERLRARIAAMNG